MGNGEGEGRGLLGTGSEQLRRQQLREITAEEELGGAAQLGFLPRIQLENIQGAAGSCRT